MIQVRTRGYNTTVRGKESYGKGRKASVLHVVLLGPHAARRWLIALKLALSLLAISGLALFRTAVPFWGQPTQMMSSLSPNRDCGTVRVNAKRGSGRFAQRAMEKNQLGYA